ILLNKADRLPAGEMASVLEHVREGLAEAGLVSHAPPISFSARLSLQGRLGDEAALAASGWSEVEELFAREIVDRSNDLRERALRRKAGRVAVALADLAAVRAEEDRAAQREARARTEALRGAAAKLRRDRAGLA